METVLVLGILAAMGVGGIVCLRFFYQVLRKFSIYPSASSVHSNSDRSAGLFQDVLSLVKTRDRAVSFDEWAGEKIELEAIGEISSGKWDKNLESELREKWSDNWELFYPKARVRQELSREGIWSLIKKFDDHIAEELGEEILPSRLDNTVDDEGERVR